MSLARNLSGDGGLDSTYSDRCAAFPYVLSIDPDMRWFASITICAGTL
jgi:hypothetical protein